MAQKQSDLSVLFSFPFHQPNLLPVRCVFFPFDTPSPIYLLASASINATLLERGSTIPGPLLRVASFVLFRFFTVRASPFFHLRSFFTAKRELPMVPNVTGFQVVEKESF